MYMNSASDLSEVNRTHHSIWRIKNGPNTSAEDQMEEKLNTKKIFFLLHVWVYEYYLISG